MSVRIPVDEAAAEKFLGGHVRDGSGVGINYADVFVKAMKVTLEDGRKVACKRRGLKLTLTVGDRTGEGLLRRLLHGPDEKTMFRECLGEAARNAGASVAFEPGAVLLDPDGGSAVSP
jgi:hypothetical protein